jgi:hypothetical protein
MDIKYLINLFEEQTKSKVLFAANELPFDFETVFWPELSIKSLCFVSLGQDRKVLMATIDEIDIKSYSYEIWFEVSGWSQEPFLNSQRLSLFLLGNYYYINDVFRNRLLDLIKNEKIVIRGSRRRPTYLRDQFDLVKTKKCLAKLLLHYWFVNGCAGLPKTLDEMLCSGKIPDDLIGCTMLLKGALNDNSVTQPDQIKIVEVIIKHHELNNGLFSLGGLRVPNEVFMSLRNDLSKMC